MYCKLALLLSVILIHGSVYAESIYSISSGAKIFKKCQNCHQIGEGAENRVGPQLNNIFGRTAGGLPGVKYSKSMVQAGEEGLVWNNETLNSFIENPKKLMELVEKFVKKAVEEFKESLSQAGQRWKNTTELKKEKSLWGECPLCQGPIMDYPKSFSCGRWNQGCPLIIWKEVAGKKLGVTHVKSLLAKGRTEKIKGFKSKKGRAFEAKLMFSNEGKVTFSFDD